MTFIATAQDFEVATAFERLAVDQLVSAADMERVASELDLRTEPHAINVESEDDLAAPSLDQMRRNLRPLAFFAAWKVIDLLIEFGLNRSANAATERNWSIKDKQTKATQGNGDCPPLSADTDLWPRLCRVYAETVEVRHCLTHREFVFSSAGDMTGIVDRNGQARPDVTALEQEAFCRAARLAANAVIFGSLTMRERSSLIWCLDQLRKHHGLPLVGGGARPRPVELVRINATRDAGGWTADLEHAFEKAKTVFEHVDYFDVEINFPDAGIAPLRGRLEDAPHARDVRIDVVSPPTWVLR